MHTHSDRGRDKEEGEREGERKLSYHWSEGNDLEKGLDSKEDSEDKVEPVDGVDCHHWLVIHLSKTIRLQR